MEVIASNTYEGEKGRKRGRTKVEPVDHGWRLLKERARDGVLITSSRLIEDALGHVDGPFGVPQDGRPIGIDGLLEQVRRIFKPDAVTTKRVQGPHLFNCQ